MFWEGEGKTRQVSRDVIRFSRGRFQFVLRPLSLILFLMRSPACDVGDHQTTYPEYVMHRDPAIKSNLLSPGLPEPICLPPPSAAFYVGSPVLQCQPSHHCYCPRNLLLPFPPFCQFLPVTQRSLKRRPARKSLSTSPLPHDVSRCSCGFTRLPNGDYEGASLQALT